MAHLVGASQVEPHVVLQRAFEHETKVLEGLQVAGGAAVGFAEGKAERVGEEGKVLDQPKQRNRSL